MSRTDDLVEELLTIEDSYHAKERRHKKIPKKEIVFSATDKDKAVSIIMKLIKDHKLNVEEIKEKIDKQVKWDKFWRINELLDDIQSQRLEEAYKRLSFAKSTNKRLGKHSNVELREHELIEDILSNMTNDKVKSGKKKKRKSKKKKRKTRGKTRRKTGRKTRRKTKKKHIRSKKRKGNKII